MGGPSLAKIAVKWEPWTSKPSGRGIWKPADDPHHKKFISWHVDNFSFSFFFPWRVGEWCGPLWKISLRFFIFATFPWSVPEFLLFVTSDWSKWEHPRGFFENDSMVTFSDNWQEFPLPQLLTIWSCFFNTSVMLKKGGGIRLKIQF